MPNNAYPMEYSYIPNHCNQDEKLCWQYYSDIFFRCKWTYTLLEWVTLLPLHFNQPWLWMARTRNTNRELLLSCFTWEFSLNSFFKYMVLCWLHCIRNQSLVPHKSVFSNWSRVGDIFFLKISCHCITLFLLSCNLI